MQKYEKLEKIGEGNYCLQKVPLMEWHLCEANLMEFMQHELQHDSDT